MRSPRTRLSTILLSAASVLTLGACSAAGGEGPEDADHLTVQLDFQVRGLHSMFFVADELGYFDEEGIVVDDILTGTSSGETLRLVGGGEGDIGVSDLPTLVVARSQNVPVKALAAVNQRSPLAMCAKKERFDLETPEDLRGLKVGVQASGSTYVFYRALLAANGIDQSDMEEFTVNPPYENYLLTDQVDTVPCYLDAEFPILADHAGGEDNISVLRGDQWGYEAYGTGLFASDDFIAENQELVERFMQAYLKAFDYVIDNPDEAARIVADSDPQLADSAELFTAQLEADIADSFTSDATEAAGLGAMTDEQWQATIDILAEQDVIETTPTVDEVRDDGFLGTAEE